MKKELIAQIAGTLIQFVDVGSSDELPSFLPSSSSSTVQKTGDETSCTLMVTSHDDRHAAAHPTDARPDCLARRDL